MGKRFGTDAGVEACPVECMIVLLVFHIFPFVVVYTSVVLLRIFMSRVISGGLYGGYNFVVGGFTSSWHARQWRVFTSNVRSVLRNFCLVSFVALWLPSFVFFVICRLLVVHKQSIFL